MARNKDDLAIIRNYLMGPGPVALLDLPWMPIYFAILFLVNPILFLAAAGGALLLVILSLVNEFVTKGLCCADRTVSTSNAPVAEIQAIRTVFGRPSSSMRFRA